METTLIIDQFSLTTKDDIKIAGVKCSATKLDGLVFVPVGNIRKASLTHKDAACVARLRARDVFIVHVASGKSLGLSFASKANATACIDALAALGVDFTADDLKKSLSLDTLKTVIRCVNLASQGTNH